jgi:NAD(P)-dependent dehydrogenase (short-subunit alcohol dehydrogenase family)
VRQPTRACSLERSNRFPVVAESEEIDVGTEVALVTGSGKRGVGWHVASALAARGYALAIHYRSSPLEGAEVVDHFRRQGVDAVGLQADLTDDTAARSLADQVLASFGRLDVWSTALPRGGASGWKK